MYAIIVGGGRIGYHLADALIKGGNEVLIIERDARRSDLINRRREQQQKEPSHIALKGDGTEPRVLQEAGARRADVLIAVTGNDEDNLMACLVASRLFGVRRTIALVNNPQNGPLFRALGVKGVSATDILMAEIQEELPVQGHLGTAPLTEGLEVVEIEIPESSWVVGKRLQEVEKDLPSRAMVVAVMKRTGDLFRVEPTTLIQASDHIIALTPTGEGQALIQLLTEAA